ncbi:MAG: hypothetical protein BLM47_10950 [Candidatus Reconcilbacillus cellulovorans]|uniref:ATP-grasp domain-containing protein n=1 Tax=Candidatus Reconcilbacillus cellulovorans TaxID=1906605 RepID=A0A2A6DY59_9BACL|nr:MAG: hypothetical protein BLM47_10950 [Candidatus Reconcilbacillus cellulovorans]
MNADAPVERQAEGVTFFFFREYVWHRVSDREGEPFVKVRLLRCPGDKWIKHLALASDPRLFPYLPETDLFSIEAFLRFMEKYSAVFVKPVLGGGGRGVIRAERSTEGGGCLLRTPQGDMPFPDEHNAALWLKTKSRGRRYLVQQAVDLLRWRDRPIDIRVLLHFDSPEHSSAAKKRWRVLGMIGKIAAPGAYVTNRRRGGRAVPLFRVLKVTGVAASELEVAEWERRLAAFSLLVAETLKLRFPRIEELGLDIAVDTTRRIWLLEANTRPRFQLFRHHPDPRLYAAISAATRKLRARHRSDIMRL